MVTPYERERRRQNAPLNADDWGRLLIAAVIVLLSLPAIGLARMFLIPGCMEGGDWPGQ